jgi:hypothetical protein
MFKLLIQNVLNYFNLFLNKKNKCIDNNHIDFNHILFNIDINNSYYNLYMNRNDCNKWRYEI